MIHDYSELQLSTDTQPAGIYYTPAANSRTRRQQKHDMLLTFFRHANTPKRKRRTAPVKPTLLHTLLSMLAECFSSMLLVFQAVWMLCPPVHFSGRSFARLRGYSNVVIFLCVTAH